MEAVLEQQKATVLEAEASSEDQALDQEITIKFLLKFAAPTMISMVVLGVMGTVDGIFVSRLLGAEALAAVNIVWPFLMFAMSIGFMLGTGGNALVATTIGRGQKEAARRHFSLILVTGFVISALLSGIGLVFPYFIMDILGTNEAILSMSLSYMTPLLWFMPTLILGVMFQQFFMTEGKAHIGMMASIVGAIVNIVLNWLFLAVLEMGLAGAALATGINYTIPAIVGVVFFASNRKGTLFFQKFKLDLSVLWQSSTNGVSEMITMGASSVTMTFMNNILMELDGPLAVASLGIIFAGQGLLVNAFMGYTSGVAPVVSYNFGRGKSERLKKMFQKSLFVIGAMAVGAAFLGLFVMRPLLWVFDVVPTISIYGAYFANPVYHMSQTGFRFVLVGFFFVGFNVFSSAWFTALNNGLVSGILSFFRTFVFILVTLWTLPQLFAVNGVWMALPAAELLSLTVTIFFFRKMRRKYQYA